MPFYMLHVCVTLTPKFYRRKWHSLKGGSNNSEIGNCALSEVYIWKFERKHSGLVTEQTFRNTPPRVRKSHFRIAELKKTEILEPPLNNKYLTLRLGSERLEMPNCCEGPNEWAYWTLSWNRNVEVSIFSKAKRTISFTRIMVSLRAHLTPFFSEWRGVVRATNTFVQAWTIVCCILNRSLPQPLFQQRAMVPRFFGS